MTALGKMVILAFFFISPQKCTLRVLIRSTLARQFFFVKSNENITSWLK